MRRIGWRLMCRSAARRPSWLSQSSGSQPQPGLRRGAVGMVFAQAPLRVQRGGPADRRRGFAADADARRGSPAWAGRQPAVQGQPAIGAGDGMDADAVQAGERAYRRQHGPGRQRPPLDRPAHGRDHLFHQRRRGVIAHGLELDQGFGHHARPVQLQFSRLYKRPGLAWGVYFQTWRAYSRMGRMPLVTCLAVPVCRPGGQP